MKLLLSTLLLASLFAVAGCTSSSTANLNNDASLAKTDQLEENPLEMFAITSSINPSKNTMSTLYGNDLAANYARTHSDANYPDNAVLYEVTWQQKDDEDWFGAKIPKRIMMVEKLTFERNEQGTTATKYAYFAGSPLKRQKAVANKAKIDFIQKQRLAAAP